MGNIIHMFASQHYCNNKYSYIFNLSTFGLTMGHNPMYMLSLVYLFLYIYSVFNNRVEMCCCITPLLFFKRGYIWFKTTQKSFLYFCISFLLIRCDNKRNQGIKLPWQIVKYCFTKSRSQPALIPPFPLKTGSFRWQKVLVRALFLHHHYPILFSICQSEAVHENIMYIPDDRQELSTGTQQQLWNM